MNAERDNTNYAWIDFYMELATKLLPYKDNRDALIEKIRTVYKNIGIKLPKLESDSNPKDMDPFTVYGLFNKRISNANRIAIIKGIASEFEVNAAIPVAFDGIPVLNNLRATFYWFQEDRGEHDIDHLWSLFESALSFAENGSDSDRQSFITTYNAVLKQQGIRWNITMGLFWIRPFAFVNLDSRNRWYMSDPQNMPADFVAKVKPHLDKVPSAEQYLEIIQLCKAALDTGNYDYKIFPELSYYAWIVSEKVNQERREARTGKKSGKSNAAHIRWTRPIIQALRDLGGSGTPAEVREKIVENEHLTQEEISVTRGKTNVNKFENEVAFARNDLVVGGYIDKSIHGVWTLTEAGKTVDITDEMASDLFRNAYTESISKRSGDSDALADSDVDTVRYWIYTPRQGAEKWDECYKKGIMLLGWGEIGDLGTFDSKDEMKQKMKEVYGDISSYKNSAHAAWQFVHDIKPGDIVFVKKEMNQILGRGVVKSDYEYDADRTDGYNNVRHVKWTNKGVWTIEHQTPQKILMDITPYGEIVQQIKDLFDDNVLDEDEDKAVVYPPYSVDDFLDDVYMDEETYDNIVSVLKIKKNIILQGAPGVGKTFVAKRLAYAIMGVKDIDRVMMVQFHQSYSYEDFIMGFRPTVTGFELRKGEFYNFCKKAEIDSDNDYFFIIDEINRGNLNKIFGELFMLIENDKRGIELQLLYSDEKFSVPKNVYIIGMMNTADRSLAMLDYALRRRFAFIELKPGFKTEGFKTYRVSLDNVKFGRLITCVESLNKAIADDESLGEGFCIGHSYFCNLTPETVDDKVLSGIVEYELIPLLKEYWFDEPTRVRDWTANLRSAIK
ncbi:AAA family ATPase [Sporolactobacillus sp. THM7-4]|nr:AAA family ATPase [Sporolactobacillus sp. THM7-4]